MRSVTCTWRRYCAVNGSDSPPVYLLSPLQGPAGKLGSADEQLLSQIVAELGVRSGRAQVGLLCQLCCCSQHVIHSARIAPWLQALSAPITTLQRVLQRGQFLLIHCFRNGASTKVQGFIKTGILNLFLADVRTPVTRGHAQERGDHSYMVVSALMCRKKGRMMLSTHLACWTFMCVSPASVRVLARLCSNSF